MASEAVLYSFRRCPYAIRARLALAISETPGALREVHLARKPAAMLAASTKATVPVLVLADGTVIDESIMIMRWALARSDPEVWLERDDADLIARNDGPFKSDLDRYKYPDRHQSDASAHRERGLEFLRMLDARLSNSPQLCGAKRGLADAAIMPFVRQFAAVDPRMVRGPADLALASVASRSSRIAAVCFGHGRFAPWSPGDPEVAIPGVVPKGQTACPLPH